MSDQGLKVTDRRMFTADGELREEYRDLATPPADRHASEPAAEAPRPPAEPLATPRPPAAAPGPAPPEDPDAPGFPDLVGLLAEPATIYLQQARGGDPRTATESLEMARLHIDLLAVLRAKTEGNLSSSEKAMLDDVLYQLRSGFVGLRG